MKIDAHVHIGRWRLPDFLGRECTLPQALQVFETCRIGGAVVMPTDEGDNRGLLESVRQLPDRSSIWVFAWARPGDEQTLDYVRSHGAAFDGLKIHPSLDRFQVTAAEYEPYLDLAAALEIPVSVHCGRWQEMASYKLAIEAARRHESVSFILGHAGGDTPQLAIGAAREAAERGCGNVFFDIAGLREYWALERAIAILGAERYLFASDFPLAYPGSYLAVVEALDISREDKARLFGLNALGILGMPRNK